MPTLPDSLARLRMFRQSFDDGEICEESGLTTADVDLILSVLELNEVVPNASRDATDDVLGKPNGS